MKTLQPFFTVSNGLKERLRDHIESLVDFQGAGYEEPSENTLRNAANQLWNECAKYYQGTRAKRLTEGLQGLPSYINIPFYNFDIKNLMKALGHDETEEGQSVDLYWRLCGEILAEA